MKVILLEDVVGKGKAGDVVTLSDGYARNFLLPKGIAIPANETNMKNLEHRRVKLAEQRARNIEEAQGVKDRLDGLKVTLQATSGEGGRLFGSITSQDIADALDEQHHITIDKKKILLAAHIKETGTQAVDIRLFPEVIATITVSVEPVGGVKPVEPEAVIAETVPEEAYDTAGFVAETGEVSDFGDEPVEGPDASEFESDEEGDEQTGEDEAAEVPMEAGPDSDLDDTDR